MGGVWVQGEAAQGHQGLVVLMVRSQFGPAAAQMWLFWLHGNTQLGCTGGATTVTANPGAHCVLATAHGEVGSNMTIGMKEIMNCSWPNSAHI